MAVGKAYGSAGAGSAYVLDDEPRIGALVCQVLVACGFAPRPFTSLPPFLAELEAAPPELVMLDLSLGSSDAVEVMHQLEALRYDGRVLLISGHDEATLVEFARIGERHGLTMLPPLRKPFRPSDLKSRLVAAEKELRAEAKGARAETKAPKRIAVDLGEALQNGWLELWYQPKIDLKSGSVCGAEALLRAEHPEHGTVLPSELLPPAGSSLYDPLSKFVIRRAMTDWIYFADLGMPLKLAVNLPASFIQVPEFVGMVRHILPRDPKFPGLVIEITESEAIRDAARIHEVAMQLKLCNAWISIDDFGVAHSSLSRLLDFPCIELKLDIKFVAGCSSEPLKKSLCQTVVDLAHRLGAVACAEGVENAADLRALADMGCDAAQGFLLARPMRPPVFIKSVLAQRARSMEAAPASQEPDGGEPRHILTA